jgi:hypothetical protein
MMFDAGFEHRKRVATIDQTRRATRPPVGVMMFRVYSSILR